MLRLGEALADLSPVRRCLGAARLPGGQLVGDGGAAPLARLPLAGDRLQRGAGLGLDGAVRCRGVARGLHLPGDVVGRRDGRQRFGRRYASRCAASACAALAPAAAASSAASLAADSAKRRSSAACVSRAISCARRVSR